MPTAMQPPASAAERFPAALDLLAMTQAELADRADCSQATISSIVRGTRVLTDEVYGRIVTATGLPQAFFEAVDDIDVEQILFRRRRTAPSRTTRRARRTFAELYRVAGRLMDAAGQPAAALPEPVAAGAAELNAEEIEDAAEEARVRLRLSKDGPIGHVCRALERAHIPVAPIVFGDDEDAEPEAAVGHFGISHRAHGRAAVGFFPSAGDRQRFTLAHELGHLVLHSPARAGLDDAAAEREADRFAGSFLLPLPVARGVFAGRLDLRGYATLKAEYGVSIQALVQRAYAIGAIDDDRRMSLYKQISARGWRRREPVEVAAELPELLPQLLRRRYQSERSPYVGRASELGLPPVILRSLIPGPSAPSAPAAHVIDLVSRR